MDFLKDITHGFSDEQKLGSGGFGVVYKGVLQNGREIAVKKLIAEMDLDDDQFQKEVTNLYGLGHQNVVQLVGYCAESRWEAKTLESGKHIMAESRERLLCFEYLNNKSLDKHISVASTGLDWHKRYDLIRGICCGLQYLHTEPHIVHLDLKPQNILLDGNMVPKIADFGMSRLFGEQRSGIITARPWGTPGYMAPEYMNKGLISNKPDIFSLGVIIIEIVTGKRDYPYSEADFEQLIEDVVANWRNRLQETGMPMDKDLQQVNTCISIGLSCVNPDPNKRPSANVIMEKLDSVDHGNMFRDVLPVAFQEPQADASSSNSDDEREAPSWVGPVAATIGRVLGVIISRKLSRF